MDKSKLTAIELAAGLIRVFEGLSLVGYLDAVQKPTIGYGHTGLVRGAAIIPKVTTITEAEAEALLATDASHLVYVTSDRPLLEAAALISFGYNLGTGPLKRVLAGQSFLGDFTRAGGKELAGLVSRRHLEELLIVASQQITLPKS